MERAEDHIPMEAWRVDYAKFARTLRGMDYVTAAATSREWLHYDWEESYIARTPFPHDILLLDRGKITFCVDFQFEPDIRFVSIPPEQIEKEARVVVAFGLSSRIVTKRPTSAGFGMRAFVGPTEKYFGPNYDKGHFISHQIGGDLNWNLFPQLREINRGWSKAGKRFREMERFCRDHPGTFLFSRPLYSDFTSRPAALEFGVLKEDRTFWVEIFPNTPQPPQDPHRERTSASS